MPTEPFTNTAVYYKMLSLHGLDSTIPLATKFVGVFDGGSIANVGSLQEAAHDR